MVNSRPEDSSSPSPAMLPRGLTNQLTASGHCPCEQSKVASACFSLPICEVETIVPGRVVGRTRELCLAHSKCHLCLLITLKRLALAG